MHLLFDARVLQPHFPGIGRYARALLGALVEVAPDLRLTLLTEPRAERPEWPGARWIEAPPIFSLAAQLRVPWLARHSGADLFHAPYYLYPYAVPLPTLVTIHDLIPLDFPYTIPAGKGRYLYRPLHLIAARRATHVITDSEGAREAILRHLRLGADRVTTIHAAPDPFFTPNPAVQREPFLFALLSNKPHKNAGRLLRAFAATDPASHGVPLHIAGPHDPDWPSIEALATEAGVRQWVSLLGRIPETALRDAYRRCLAFVFPSYAEGFGLPLLEAMACAAPTAAADLSPMRDLAGAAALRFDPFSEQSIAQALHILLHDPARRADLAQAGWRRAAAFTWQRAAHETLALYDKVVG